MIEKKLLFIIFFGLLLLVRPLSLSSQVWWEDSGRTLDYDLSPFRILVLLGEDFDYQELTVIKNHLEKWKAKVTIAGSDELLTGHLWNITSKGFEKTEFHKIKADLLLSKVDVEDYQALFLPGGNSSKNLIEKNRELVLKLIQEADRKELLLSAICHGPYALAEAGVIKGHEVTGHKEIMKNLTEAGGKYVSEVCVIDQNILTGNWPYFESFALSVAEKLLFPGAGKKSELAEIESHPALKVIKERRSIRKFQDKDVDPFLIEELLYMGTWAPSSNNDQPWRFVVVKDKETKSKIFDLFAERMKGYYQKRGIPVERIKAFWSGHFTAPVFIFVFSQPQREEADKEFSEMERIWDIQSAANACQNILLAAKALDLGSCWMGALLVIEEEIRQILQAADDARLMAVLAVGYPAEKPLPRIRKSLSETAYCEKWGKRF